jgi:aldehyde dehydrogenase family 7 protein A1
MITKFVFGVIGGGRNPCCCLKKSIFAINSALSYSSMTNYLVNQPAYSFLKELGITELNAGVFDGKSWKASGTIVDSIDPATNMPIAKVQFATNEVFSKFNFLYNFK